MKLKGIFGALLTFLGVAGLVYAAVLFVNESQGIRYLLVYGILGLIFFISGIGLIKKLE
jgi:hypothetical protein